MTKLLSDSEVRSRFWTSNNAPSTAQKGWERGEKGSKLQKYERNFSRNQTRDWRATMSNNYAISWSHFPCSNFTFLSSYFFFPLAYRRIFILSLLLMSNGERRNFFSCILWRSWKTGFKGHFNPDIAFSGEFWDFSKILPCLWDQNYYFFSILLCYQKSTTLIFYDTSDISSNFKKLVNSLKCI